VSFLRARLGAGRDGRGVTGAGRTRLEDASRSLFEHLFPEEIRPSLEAADRVVVSPGGPLWDLPFAALIVGEKEDADTRPGERWLGLEKALSYAPSLTTLSELRDRAAPSRERDVLIVGDPLLEPAVPGEVAQADSPGDAAPETPADPDAIERSLAEAGSQDKDASDALALSERTLLFPGEEPPPLPGAREEAERLAELYATPPLLGREATESAVRARLARSTLVHLATHGYFHPTRPMSSGILLALPRDDPTGAENDGALLAWEILGGLEVPAELVVLAACETGLGRAVRGEGLVGLTRALHAAGARSVVATHWKVADRASTDMMVSFHQKLGSGVAKDEALRQAIREIADRPGTSHPYFWAGFFLTGEADRPLASRASLEAK